MKAIAARYHSFLLRMWRDDFEGDWRASLQDVKSGECHYFASLEAMINFLISKTGEAYPQLTNFQEHAFQER